MFKTECEELEAVEIKPPLEIRWQAQDSRGNVYAEGVEWCIFTNRSLYPLRRCSERRPIKRTGCISQIEYSWKPREVPHPLSLASGKVVQFSHIKYCSIGDTLMFEWHPNGLITVIEP